MKKIVIAEVASNQEIASGIFKLCLNMPADYPDSEPGQFVNLYLNDASLLLPRPISICAYAEGRLTLVYAVVGEGTRMISGYGPGEKIRVSPPFGNGFVTDGAKQCLLVGGGVGTPPLLFLAKKLAADGGADVRAVLGFQSQPFLTDEFPCDVHIATDDGSAGFKGSVVELLAKTDIPAGTQMFACGPKPMLKALAQFASERGIPWQVSLEEHMGCGFGACVSCVCNTTGGVEKVCVNGPVLNGSEVIWDE